MRLLRGLFLLAALLAGVVLAVLTQGRMAHLRLFLPGALPGWSDTVSGDASVIVGRASLPLGDADRALLVWQADWPAVDGPAWRLRLAGPGIEAAGRLRAGWTGDRVWLENGTGRIELSALPRAPAGIDGLIDLSRVEAEAARHPGMALPVATLRVAGAWRGARFRGSALGAGPVAAQLDPLGSWRISAQPDGPLGRLSVMLNGRLGLPRAGVDLTLPDGPDLPPDWRRALELGGNLSDGVWTLQTAIPVAAGG